eukprot:UN25336
MYVKPEILPIGSKKFDIKGARHPCVEQIVDSYIANDIQMSSDERFQLITGPNMGGKSTYCRTVALIAIMALIGSYVPASSASMSVVDSIRCRIGAGDHQLGGVSTFMAEMLDISSILEGSSENTLVVIDELGRGTSTSDGYGIARAIAEHMASKIRCFCLFATHFHELTYLSKTVQGVVNKHVTAAIDNDNITMMYELNKGPCNQSFGLHVAKLAQFPQTVLEEARIKAKELEDGTKRTLKNIIRRYKQ